MIYLTAEFRDRAAAAEAIRLLRENGIAPADLDVFSEEPVEFPRGVLDRSSRISLVSVLGGILFGVLATAFIFWTQHDYPLITGGMPLSSFWATGVITFEMTMLGASLAAFVWFLRESGLIGRRDRSAPVPHVDPGSLCLRVRCPAEKAGWASESLRRTGAIGFGAKGE